MHSTLQVGSIYIAMAVLMFIGIAVAVLVIVDHKARIPAGDVDDMTSISGRRTRHPIWAWLISSFLVAVILLLLVVSVYKMFGQHVAEEPKENEIFTTLDKEHRAETIRHFHNSPAVAEYSRGVQPICYSCHGEYPHSSKPMVRTLLNMHTQFVGCMTCHIDNEKVPEDQLEMTWLNYSGIAVKGAPFGVNLDPATGNLAQTDDYFSKIVVYQRLQDGGKKLLEITEDSEEGRNFLAVRGQLTVQQQGALKKMFHTTVNPIGRFCTRCHSTEGESYIPFRDLGFVDKRVNALTNLNLVGIVQKYREFYIPTIFYGGSDAEKEKILLGKKVEVDDANKKLRNDPRSWWKQNYDAPKGEAR